MTLLEPNTFRQTYRNSGGWWEDLRFPATAVRVGANAPTYDTTNVGWTFSNNPPNNQELQAIAQFPHAYLLGSSVTAHIHWNLTVAGAANEDVKWDLLYRWYDIDAAIPAGWTTLENTVDVSAYAVNTHYMDSWTAISGAAITGVSSIMELRMQRDTADAADDHEQDVTLKEIDIHYQIDQPGSYSEAAKWG